ncbi:MAG: Yip1 family protein [Euryarchaeota archaeon]|nr:Yip1 family protein [Euryarchaeota archaeon]
MSRVPQSIYSGKVLITNPDRFFAELSGRESNLLTPFVIVIVSAVIPVIAKMICYSSIAVPVGVIVELIAPFIGWLLCAGAFYAFSIFFRGVGSFKRVLEFTGYGFIPKIPSAILNAILLSLLASLPQSIVYAITIISSLLLFWSVGIWVFAVKHARNIPAQDAFFTVAGSMVAGWLLLWGLAWILLGIMH